MSVRVRDTIDHDEIRRSIQLHHGAPARVSHPGVGEVRGGSARRPPRGPVGSLFRAHFVGEWFARFDDHHLCLRCPDDPESLSFHPLPRGAPPPTVHAINLSH